MHALILGQTESGKTTLAKILARRLRASARTVVIHDPVFDLEWPCSRRFDRVDQLSDAIKTMRQCHVFVDESAVAFDNGKCLDFTWFTARSRHWGHSFYLMAQRMVDVPKTMRDQCNRLFLFRSSRSDGQQHADEWNVPQLAECHTLKQWQFYHVDRHGRCDLMEIVARRDIRHVAHGSRGAGGSDRGPGGVVDRGRAVEPTKGFERCDSQAKTG